MERAAEHVLSTYVPPDNSAGVQGSQVLIQPGTGDVLAIANSTPYGSDAAKGQTEINYAVDTPEGGGTARGAVGSTFKMFVLAAALRQGLPLSTTIAAQPEMTLNGFTDCRGLSESPYQVHNAGDEGGTFNLETGTWDSVNTFYAQLEQRVGTCAVKNVANSLGMVQGNGSPIEQLPEMVLGRQAFGISSLDMADAYATLAAHGKYCPPRVITSITKADGDEVAIPAEQCTQALAPGLADTITSILEGVLTRPGATAATVGDPGRPAAAKTGTADFDAVSAFAGYVPQLAGFVWVGRTASGRQEEPLDNVTLGSHTYSGEVFGATIAGPIWKETFEKALAGKPVEALPTSPDPAYVNGKQTVVPTVAGDSPDDALATLRQEGFSPTLSPTQVTSTYPQGDVAYTSPGAGSTATPGTPVTVYVSDGVAPVVAPTTATTTTHAAPGRTTPTSQASSTPPQQPSTPLPPPAHSPPGKGH
jgi:membrane peptidoglycan carboxypeptidase